MKEKVLHIKNMVCPRCVMVVQDALESLGAEVEEVKLGYARIQSGPGFSTQKAAEALERLGFELLTKQDEQPTEQLRLKILEYLQLSEAHKVLATLSHFLAEAFHKNYTALSKHFARHYGQTIEAYYIGCRIERVKALLQEGELNVSQIADKLGYSSVHYLSNQFKKVTGTSISHYKTGNSGERLFLDEL